MTTPTLKIERTDTTIFLVIASKIMKENVMATITPCFAESLKAYSLMIQAKWRPLVNF